MPRKVIVPVARIRQANVLYVAGAPALDSNRDTVGIGHAKAHTRQIAQTIKAVLETAGGSMKDVTLNRIRGPEFGLSPPARYCIGAARTKSRRRSVGRPHRGVRGRDNLIQAFSQIRGVFIFSAGLFTDTLMGPALRRPTRRGAAQAHRGSVASLREMPAEQLSSLPALVTST
jgi:hypothetical protein